MSWLDKIENIQFSIKTGDGNEFLPLWKSGEKSLDFNTNTYDFIDVPKSLVTRKQPKSSKYPLTFWFQGSDCIEQAERFEQSAKDNRYWTVTHPYYGIIKGQPISISRNDANYNISEITVDFWETIIFDFPKSNLSIQDNTLVKRDTIQVNAAESYSNRAKPQTKDIQKVKDSNLTTAKQFETLQNDETNIDYQNNISRAIKSANALLVNPSQAILDSQNIVSQSALLDIDLNARINAYKNAFKTLKLVFESITDKLFFESQGATILSNLCLTATNYQFGVDYVTVPEIENTSTLILSLYDDYLSTVDSNITSVYDVDNNYQPYAVLQNDLYNLVMFTVSNLYSLAFEAQQERIVIVEKDTNIVLLCHRYYGIANDENLETFRTINNIRLNENFKIKKGRSIKYYV